MAAQISWAATADPAGRTAAARAAAFGRFERLVDPAGVLEPGERARRAEHARKAHMLRMSLAAVKARRLRAEADELDSSAAAGLAEFDLEGGPDAG